MPIAKAHSDMKDKLVGRLLRKAHSDPKEKAAIDSYLRGLTNYSPFEIFGNPPRYGQIANLLYAVVVAVASGVWAIFQKTNMDCGDHFDDLVENCDVTAD